MCNEIGCRILWCWQFLGSGWHFATLALHWIADVCVWIWWSLCIWLFIAFQHEVFAELFKITASTLWFAGCSLIAWIVPNIDRCIAIYIQLLAIFCVLWPVKCTLTGMKWYLIITKILKLIDGKSKNIVN